MESLLLSPGVVVQETYQIVRVLGRGGMGEVWLANHLRVAGKQVALKVLRAGGSFSEEVQRRFKNEAEIAARLEHPNIVQVTDYNRLPSGEPYLVMEYLKGQSVAERLRAGPFSLAALENLVKQVGSALAAAHAAGVVHRDLKPENIFLTPTPMGDQVKVLDFGISKMIDAHTVKTSDSVVLGTPSYMSPEQAMGNNSDLTAQSDLFSLATICFEVLTGQLPFRSDGVVQTLYKIASAPAPDLALLRPDLPRHVVSAIDRAHAKEPSRRTPDIAAFVAQLTGGSNSSAQPRSENVTLADRPKARPSPGSGRAPWLLGGAALVGLLVAAVLLWPRTQAVTGPPDAGRALAPDAAPAVVEVAEKGAAPATAVAPDAGSVRHASGAPAPAQADVEGPEDQELVLAFRALHEQQDDEALEAQRGRAKRINSRRLRAEAMGYVVEALCRRRSNQLLGVALRDLNDVASPKVVRQAKTACAKVYPPSADLDW